MFRSLFRRRRGALGPTGVDLLRAAASQQRIISLRINGDLDRRISRTLAQGAETRSEFIRRAIEALLRLEAEKRLRIAHSAIRWE